MNAMATTETPPFVFHAGTRPLLVSIPHMGTHIPPELAWRMTPLALQDTAPPPPQLARHGFEIVDKRSGKEVYLDGSWAEMFQLQIIAWQRDAPTQEEVEDTLDSYTGLAQNPVVVH